MTAVVHLIQEEPGLAWWCLTVTLGWVLLLVVDYRDTHHR